MSPRARLGRIWGRFVTVQSQTRGLLTDSVTAEGGGTNTPTLGGGYGFSLARESLNEAPAQGVRA